MFYKNNSKKIINTKFSLVVCLLFLLYFFSNNLIYATSPIKTMDSMQLCTIKANIPGDFSGYDGISQFIKKIVAIH